MRRRTFLAWPSASLAGTAFAATDYARVEAGRALVFPRDHAAREGFGLAGADTATMRAWIGDRSLALADNRYTGRIVGSNFALDLRFTPTQPLLPQGDAGFSRKGPLPAQASYYCSAPQLAVAGSLRVNGDEVAVTGTAWLDHEWSSELLMAGAVGWDWTGINLADVVALMAFRMRDKAGATLWARGTLRSADGGLHTLSPGDVRFVPSRSWRSARTGIVYPVAMEVAAGGIELALEPLLDDQELDSRASTGAIYWEGAVRADARRVADIWS